MLSKEDIQIELRRAQGARDSSNPVERESQLFLDACSALSYYNAAEGSEYRRETLSRNGARTVYHERLAKCKELGIDTQLLTAGKGFLL